jgi:putative membrane protein
MKFIYLFLLSIVIIEHLYFLYLEMFAWETRGKVAFKGALPSDLFSTTKKMAANQGLYNGFLAAGLIWTLFISDPVWQKNIAIFFLSCVAVAGIYGGWSVNKKIFYLQGIPALLALSFCLFA